MPGGAGLAAVIALALAASCLLSPAARAQSTDGYHAIQVFPVVVDTASFKQRFHFRSATGVREPEVTVTYYPADGTGGSGPIQCPSFALPAFGNVGFESLRGLCQGSSGDLLPGTSAFGTLVVMSPSGRPFAAFSRVSNPAGAGFSVEPIRASDFTTAESVAIGLRRSAATATTPAFQTNCFAGMLAELAPPSVLEPIDVTVTLRDKANGPLGHTVVSLRPGRLVRLLDVFAAVGLPPGDYDEATAIFSTANELGPMLVAFCTVQDNTSFGADFRIAKQENGNTVVGARDYFANRSTTDLGPPTPPGTTPTVSHFVVGEGKRNVHEFHFRTPDIVGCMLTSPNYKPLTPEDGLEMRLLASSLNFGLQPIAGGNDAVGFDAVYLGDKRRWFLGANAPYYVEVEHNGRSASLGYFLSCWSGTGHTFSHYLFGGLPATF